MIELIHASAPRGLLDDRGGYTVVACSEGIPRQLAADLAAGSTASVRRIAANVDPEPYAVYRLWTLRGEYGDFRVVTRIVPVPADHTGRPSRLAHHLAIRSAEAAPTGIAALLADPATFRTTWETEPAFLPARTMTPAAAAPPAESLEALERLTEHGAAWGSHLASLASQLTERPQLVLVPDGTPLRLVMAAIAACSSPGRAVRAETSCDHLVDARPALLVLRPMDDRPMALEPLVDWSNARGGMPPASREPEPARQLAPRRVPGPDLSGLQAPEAAHTGLRTLPAPRLAATLQPGSQAGPSAGAARHGAWIALAVYAIGTIIGGACAIVIANAAGLGGRAP